MKVIMIDHDAFQKKIANIFVFELKEKCGIYYHSISCSVSAGKAASNRLARLH